MAWGPCELASSSHPNSRSTSPIAALRSVSLLPQPSRFFMSSEETTLKREVNAVFLVVSRDGQQKDYSAKQVRAALQQRGWQCSQEQWESKWRKVVKEEWHSLLVSLLAISLQNGADASRCRSTRPRSRALQPSSDAGSEQEEPEDVKVATPAKRKPKNKYDAAAERNLGVGLVSFAPSSALADLP